MYWYEYFARTEDGTPLKKIVPITEEIAIGLFVHESLERLSRGRKKGKKYAPYASKDDFADSMAGMWIGEALRTGKIKDREVAWKGATQEEKKKRAFAIANGTIEPMCEALYATHEQEGKPPYVEETLKWIGSDGRDYQGRADEIRPQPNGHVLIRDHKSGKWEPDPTKRKGEVYFGSEAEPTFHVEGLRNRVVIDPEFARALGISDDERQKWTSREYAYERITFEFNYLQTGHRIPVRRRPDNLTRVQENIRTAEADIAQGRWTLNPKPETCGRCLYYDACQGKGLKYGPQQPQRSQLLLFDPGQLLQRAPAPQEAAPAEATPTYKQKTLRFKKPKTG
jgi:hypothetical protein